MKVTLPILDKNDTWTQHKEKLIEEAIETETAIIQQDKINIAEEALDTIQVCIGILDKLSEEGINIEQAIDKHNLKLINRGWKIKGIVNIDKV